MQTKQMKLVVVFLLCAAFCIAQSSRSITGTIRNTFLEPLKLVNFKLNNPAGTKVVVDFAKEVPVSKKAFTIFELVGNAADGVGGVVNYISDASPELQVKVGIFFNNLKAGGNYSVTIDPGAPWIGGVDFVKDPQGNPDVNAANATVQYFLHQMC
jgi:hypothetical protein